MLTNASMIPWINAAMTRCPVLQIWSDNLSPARRDNRKRHRDAKSPLEPQIKKRVDAMTPDVVCTSIEIKQDTFSKSILKFRLKSLLPQSPVSKPVNSLPSPPAEETKIYLTAGQDLKRAAGDDDAESPMDALVQKKCRCDDGSESAPRSASYGRRFLAPIARRPIPISPLDRDGGPSVMMYTETCGLIDW
jgi:hypothetical protein